MSPTVCQRVCRLFCAVHSHQLEFSYTRLPTLVCCVKAALGECAQLFRVLPNFHSEFCFQLFICKKLKDGGEIHPPKKKFGTPNFGDHQIQAKLYYWPLTLLFVLLLTTRARYDVTVNCSCAVRIRAISNLETPLDIQVWVI